MSVISVATIAIVWVLLTLRSLQIGVDNSTLAIELASGSFCIIAIVTIWSRFIAGKKSSGIRFESLATKKSLMPAESGAAKELDQNRNQLLGRREDDADKKIIDAERKSPKGILLILAAANLVILSYDIIANLIQREPALNVVVQISVTILSIIGTISLWRRIKSARNRFEKKRLKDDKGRTLLDEKLPRSTEKENWELSEKQEQATIQFGLYRLGRGAFLASFTAIFGMIFFGAYMLVIYTFAVAGVEPLRGLFLFLTEEPAVSSNLFTFMVFMGYVGALMCALIVWEERNSLNDLYFKIFSRLS